MTAGVVGMDPAAAIWEPIPATASGLTSTWATNTPCMVDELRLLVSSAHLGNRA